MTMLFVHSEFLTSHPAALYIQLGSSAELANLPQFFLHVYLSVLLANSDLMIRHLPFCRSGGALNNSCFRSVVKGQRSHQFSEEAVCVSLSLGISCQHHLF